MIFHNIQHHTTKLEREIDKKSPPYGGLQEFLLYLTVENPSKGYFGAYWEHEFSGDAKASVAGYSTGTPSLKGNSGILEIGWLHHPQNSNFTLDLGLTAACGKQRGLAGKAGMVWKF